jgi:GTPase SAR1 family protein
VYSCSEVESFTNVEQWLDQIKQNASPNVKCILVANKCDVPANERVVSEEKGRALATKYEMKYFETSAKENFRVNDAFMEVTDEILEEVVKEGEGGSGGRLSLGGNANGAGGCC